MSKVKLLIPLVILVLSLIVQAAPLSLNQLKTRVNKRQNNLDLLDYPSIFQNIDELSMLEKDLSNNLDIDAAKKQQEFDEKLTATYLMTFESLKIETRAIWIDNIYLANINSKNDVTKMMEWLSSLNFNLILPDVYNQGQSIYPSKIVPQHYKYKSLYKGDLLADMVEEAHRLGMEIHPLVVLFGLDSEMELFFDDLTVFDRDIDGNYLNIYGQAFLSPASPVIRERLISVLKEIATYDVDGIHLDYVRFSTGFGYGEIISNIFENFYGVRPKDISPTSSLNKCYQEFKTQFVSSFVDRATREIRSINPRLIVSAAVASPYDWGKYDLAQDHKHWLNNRFIHSLILMSYSLYAELFTEVISKDYNYIQNKAFTLPGMGLYNWDGKEYVRQIEASHDLPFTGQASFSAVHLKGNKETFLKEGPYREQATLTIRYPQKAATLILQDLALRLKLTAAISGLNQETISNWETKLNQAALGITHLSLRPWPERDLKEGNAAEKTAVLTVIKNLDNLIEEACTLGRASQRVTLEINRARSLLEMYKHFSSSYSYTPISYN